MTEGRSKPLGAEVRGAVAALVRGDQAIDSATVEPDGGVFVNRPVARGGALLPGSFNPLHDGHLRLAAAAAMMLSAPVTFELSVTNVDKPPLDAETVMARLVQFVGGERPVILTRAPLYSQKAALFPGCMFVVGYDTAARLFQPRYYGGSVQAMHRALATIEAARCRFLVAGRIDESGAFRTAADLSPLARFRGLLEGIPEDVFRIDVSSTALRARSLTPRPPKQGEPD